MPLMKRKIQPVKVRCHREDWKNVFEEHEDVVNNAMVGALLQLSSLTFHAEDIFREIEEEFRSIHERCSLFHKKLEELQERAQKLNPKEIPIPMSDLSTEGKIPLHLHYKSSEAVDEDFFSPDSRNPCLIHLHQSAKTGFEYKHYDTPLSPIPSLHSSFVDEESVSLKTPSPARGLSSRSTSGAVSPSSKSDQVFHRKSFLPTPEEKMKLESAQHKTEIVAVDTSGSQFERRVVLRRSQRSSVSSVRRRSQLRFRNRIQTDSTAAQQNGLHCDLRSVSGASRPSSALSDEHSALSFFASNSSACNSEPCASKHDTGIQTDDVRIFPASTPRRNARQRFSMPLLTRNKDRSQNCARVTLESECVGPANQEANGLAPSKATNNNIAENKSEPNGSTPSTRLNSNHEQVLPNDKYNSTEDRISSGFWSGTESCRHSTTSEILMQHHNVTQALKQVLAKHPPPAGKNVSLNTDDSSNVSTLSLNSHLSTFRQSPHSSLVSLDFSTPLEDRNTSPDTVFASSGRSQFTPQKFSTLPGGYNYTNPGYMDHVPHLKHLPSPMNLIQLGNRPNSSGIDQNEVKTFKVTEPSSSRKISSHSTSRAAQQSPFVSKTSKVSSSSNSSANVSSLNDTSHHFFGPNFYTTSTKTAEHSKYISTPTHPANFPHGSKNQTRIQSFRQTSISKPLPPKRSSSLRIEKCSGKAALHANAASPAGVVPVSKVATKPPIPRMECHYQTPRSPPARKIDDNSSSSFRRNSSSSNANDFPVAKRTSVTNLSENVESLHKSLASDRCSPKVENSLVVSQSATHTPIYAVPRKASRPCSIANPSLLVQHNSAILSTKVQSTNVSSSLTTTPSNDLLTSRHSSAPETGVIKVSRNSIDKSSTPRSHLTSSENSSKPTRLFTGDGFTLKNVEAIDSKKIPDVKKENADITSSSVPSNVAVLTSSQQTQKVLTEVSLSSVRTPNQCNTTSEKKPYSVTSLVSVANEILPAVASDKLSFDLERVPAVSTLSGDSTSSSLKSPAHTTSSSQSNINSLSKATRSQTTDSVTLPPATSSSTLSSSTTPSITTSSSATSFSASPAAQSSSAISSKASSSPISSVTFSPAPPVLTSSSVSSSSASSKTTPCPVTSPVPQTKKPVVRPKPFLISKRSSERSKGSDIGSKQVDIRRRTASARAAFFGLPSSLAADETERINIKTSGLDEAADTTKTVSPSNTRITNSKSSQNLESGSVKQTPVKSGLNQNQVEETDIDELEPAAATPPAAEINPFKLMTLRDEVDDSPKESKPELSNVQECEDEQEVKNHESNEDGANSQNPSLESKKTDVLLTNSSDETRKLCSSTFKNDNCLTEFNKSNVTMKKTNIANSTSSKDASSNIQVFRNSTASLISSISQSHQKRSSNELENFKAKLLQNSSRSSSGSQLSAAEKLKRDGHHSVLHSVANNRKAANQGIASAEKIRAALGSRTSRKSNHSSDHRKYPSSYGNGRRYSARKSLPSGHMLSITEDVEREDASIDESSRGRQQRSVSVTDL